MSGPDSGGTDDERNDCGRDGSSRDGADDSEPDDPPDDERDPSPGENETASGAANSSDGRDSERGHRAGGSKNESGGGSGNESEGEGERTGATESENESESEWVSESRRDDRNDGGEGESVTIEDDGIVRWFLRTNDESVVIVRDIVSSVAIVAAIGLVLFAVSGIWPPLVAVESGSMEPNMERGDLIFVVDDDRFAGDDPVGDTGVVTLENGQSGDHEKFSEPGDVIVFRPNGDPGQTPVIHRAHFWVDEGEDWVDTKADEEFVGDATCDEVRTCPAPHDGFVTKGDANSGYDQYQGGARTTVVHPDWVTGKAMFRVPWLGHIRLAFDEFFGGVIGPSIPEVAGLDEVSSVGMGVGAGAGASAGIGISASVGLVAAASRYRT